MDKFSFIGLWDAYSGLLTETQQEITNLYFNLDLTVSEIAKEKGISRQAVSECLKGCKAQLEDYEGKLHVLQRLQKSGADVEKWADSFAEAHPEHTAEMCELKRIIKRG